jgi:ATP-binding cassette subfamily F protein uup
MAAPPLLTLSDIALGFGGRPLFRDISLVVGEGERLCLVGRNGSGKSTLLKVIAGQVEPDSGTRFVQPGKSVAYLPQNPDASGYGSLIDFAAADLDPSERWRAESALDGLKVEANHDPASASGGELRRAALARLISAEADLMLLDEPTNHLDIQAIEWLEGYLAQTSRAFVLISHDRAFLSALSRGTLWIDRGDLRRSPKGFAGFETWRDEVWQQEDEERHKLDRLIKAEAHWAVYGISARRTRNQGRLRKLEGLRAERAAQITRKGTAAMALDSGQASGKLVIEAKGIAKGYDGRTLFRDFSLRVARGDCIALVGPNGAGKTTLLKTLIGQLEPDAGTVRLGANLEMAVFDQNRDALDREKSLWDTLAGDKEVGVKGRNDQIMVRGRPKHVVAYLKDFLFDERQARGPVKALSGGEVSRLLLARIMARPSNVLVLDEPTNDLDVETLDLLQELLGDYDGTVLLVSHDRDFVDRVASATIAVEGNGAAVIYAGGWSDYRAQRPADAEPESQLTKPKSPRPIEATKPPPSEAKARKLSFKQQHRLDALPAEIDQLTADITRLEGLLADPDLFTREPDKFAKATAALAQRQDKLTAAEEEWLELETLREELT